MPNLFAASNAASQPYITSRVNYGVTPLASDPNKAFQANTDVSWDNENYILHGAKILAAAPVDVLDSMAALVPGVERGQVNDAIYDSVGMQGFAQFVRQNKGGVELASGIGGAVAVGAAAELGAAKLAGSAWFAATGLGATARVQGLINIVSNAERAAAAATMDAAQAGNTLAWYQGANLNLVAAKVGVNVLKAGVSELAVAATLNKNTAVWSDNMTQNILFAGLGLGVGAAAGGIAGRGMVSRWANSDVVKDMFAEAADPGGFERLATGAPFTGLPGAGTVQKPTSTYVGMMLNARRDDSLPSFNTGSTTANDTRSSIQTQTTVEANKVLQRITAKGDKLVPLSAFGVDSSPGKQIIQASHNDPTTLYGADTVSQIHPTKSLDQVLKDRVDGIARLGASTKAADRAEAGRLTVQQPLVLIDGTLMTTADAKPFTQYTPDAVKFNTPARGINEVRFDSPHSGKQYVLQQDGSFNGTWATLPIPDQLHLQDAMTVMLDRMKLNKSTLSLPAKPEFHQIDMALQFQKLGGDVDFLKHAGFASPEAAAMESLKQKAAIALKLPTLGVHERFKLNLPAQTASERISDPTGATLRSVINQAGQRGVTLQTLQDLRVDMQRTFSITQDVKASGELDGSMFTFNRAHDNNKWMAPVVGFFDDTPAAKYTHWELGDSMAEDKGIQIGGMQQRARTAPFVANLVNGIVGDPAMPDMQTISGLADSQIGGTAGAVGASASQLLTQGFRARNSSVLTSAQNLRRVVNRFTETTVDAVLKRLSPHVTALSSIAGAESKVLLHQYMSNSAGWEIGTSKVLPDGKIGFVLRKDSKLNEDRLGRAVNSGELLANSKGNPIVLDAISNDARRAIEAENLILLRERNSVRIARGQAPVKAKAFYTNPPNTAGKKVGFTLNAANQAVPGGGIVADSQQAFEAARAELVKNLKPGQRFMTKEEIEAHDDLWDQAQLDFIDPTAMAGPSGLNRGSLSSATVNPHALEDSLQYLKHGYEQIANGTMRTVFESQLRTARIRSAAEISAKGKATGTKDIWQTFEEMLMGRPAASNPRGLTGVLNAADKWADAAIAAAWPTVTVSGEHLRNIANMAGLTHFSNVKSFADLTAQLGPRTPFADVMEYARYTHGITPPWKTKEMAGHLNRFSAAIILRWLEVPNAAMNMAGIITNMPGLLGAKNAPLIGQVGKIGIVDSMKIMSKGFTRMLSEHSGADWDMMVRNGDTTQDVSEMNQQLALLKGKSQFMRTMTGDPSLRPLPASASAADKSKNFIARKGVEGMVSIMQDTSESLARRWAHFTGLELADLHGVTGMEARHQFARSIANDTIANYDPLNRPEIYQSALGSMYGLFMSYSQNYYQRMFRWMENEDYAAVGKSLTAQAAMFGFNGLPFYQQVADLVGGEDSNSTLMDGLYKRLGPATASVIAHGGFNQLVTLLGIPAQIITGKNPVPALALNTRGDMNFRSPALDFAASGGVFKLPIGLQVIHDLVGATVDMVGKMVNKSAPITAQYAAEILARQMPNRVMHGALTVLAAGGDDADVNGNVMSETKGWAESMYRMMGFRSGRQQAEVDAYFMNQKALQIDAQRLDTVRTATRSLVRSGDTSRLSEVFDSYIKAGGKPWNYPSWIHGILQDAPNSRTQNQLLKTMRSPGMQGLAQRIELFTRPY